MDPKNLRKLSLYSQDKDLAKFSESVEKTDILKKFLKKSKKKDNSLMKKLPLYHKDKEIAKFQQSVEENETLEKVLDVISEIPTELPEKGDDGDTPIFGVDFLTQEEMDKIKDDLTPIFGLDYFTDEQIKEIIGIVTPVKGRDYLTEQEIKSIKDELKPKLGKDYIIPEVVDGYTPQVGVDYFTDEDVNKLISTLKSYIPKVKEIDALKIEASVSSKVEASILNKVELLLENKEEDIHIDKTIIELNKKDKVVDWNVLKNVPYDVLKGSSGKRTIHRGGPGQFTQLEDTPDSYVGQSGKVVKVKTDESGLEFAVDNDAQNLQQVTDVGATTDNIITVPGVQFDTAATPATNAEGLLQWNATDGTLDLGMSGGDIALQVGQEMFQKVRNVSGTTILNGKPVYTSGRTGNRPNIYLAKGDAESTSSVIGVTTQDITSPADGFVTTMGYVRGIKTDYTGTGIWGTTWASGDRLWVSKAAAGQLTNVEPTAPHHSDVVATVEIVHQNLGSILVNIDRHKTLEELSDVDETPLTTTGQFPSWNQTLGYFNFDKSIADYVPYTGSTTDVDLGNYNLTTNNLDVTGSIITVPDVTGTPSGTWTYDDNGYYFDYGISDYAIRVYAYKNLEDGTKVFSTNYAQGSDTSDPGNNEATFYFTWSWNAVAGADGYRVVFFNPDMGWNYTYYQDVTTNSFIDAIGNANWQVNPTPLATPTSAYTYSHIRKSLAITGKLTVGETINSVGEITAPTFNVTDSVNAYKVDTQTVMRFVKNDTSQANCFFGLDAGSTNTSIYNYSNTGIGNGILNSITTGHKNVGIGTDTGGALTRYSGNTLLGDSCLSYVNSGECNTFAGYQIGYQATAIGNNNVAIGSQAINNATGGAGNVVLGSLAGCRLAGNYNIFLGFAAGSRKTGSNNFIVDWVQRADMASEQANAIIWGQTKSTFATQTLRFNAKIGINLDPTAYLHLPAGSATAGTAPIKMTSGDLTTASVTGQVEFLTDKYYATITTDSVRKELTLNDITLTAGRLPYVTTNGRITNSDTILSDGTYLKVLSDTQKFLCGAGTDMSMYYNGTDGYIETDLVGASDLHIKTGTAKTLVLDTPVYDDLNFDPTSSGGPAATRPDDVTINNVFHKEFNSLNNQLCGSAQELPHSYKLSTNLEPHIHIFLKGGESAGTTGVTFTIYWELRQSTGITSGSSTTSATSAQLATTAGGNTYFIAGTAFAGSAELGGQLALTIARTAGDAGDVVVTTYGVHFQKDTIGSRTLSTK